MSAKITIIVPVYNVTHDIEECLLSLINQTLKEIEIVVVDDCGTDDSLAKVKKIAKTDVRVRIIQNETNKGLGESRNIGLHYVKTPYVAFLDADDFVAKDFYEKLYFEAQKTGADIAVGKAIYYYEKTGICREGFISRWNFQADMRIAETPEEKQYNIYACASWDKLYKTDLFTINDIKFPRRLCLEDVPVTFITVALANKLVLVPDAKIFYRQRPNSIMKKLKSSQRVFDVFEVYNYAEKMLSKLDVPQKNEYEKILDNFKIFNIYGWSKSVREDLLSEFNREMKELFSRINIENNKFITSENKRIYEEVVIRDRFIGVILYYLFSFIPILKIVRTNSQTIIKIFNRITLLTISHKTQS